MPLRPWRPCGLRLASRWPPARRTPTRQRSAPNPKLYQATVDRAIKFLALQQGEDGAVSPQIGIGPTALATLGLLRGRTHGKRSAGGQGLEVP